MDEKIVTYYPLFNNYPYQYNAHLFVNGEYAGIGWFCKDFEEVKAFAVHYGVTEIRRSR